MERRVRAKAVTFARWAIENGLTHTEAAARLGIAPRTLARWESACRQNQLEAPGRGRPATRSSRELRNRALGLIALLGPGAGTRTIQALCPEMARREVQDLLRRYRRLWRRCRRRLTRILRWKKPGTVWAIDFAEPPLPIDGTYDRLLAVRDLASGYQLAWLPAPDETAATAIAGLEALFRQHGPPLVLKSDNGSAFIAGEFQRLLERWKVCQLFSPPRTPRYNGSCEAGIGSMKTRTHHQSANRGCAGEWTCDDAEAARQAANETARPWGNRGPTPEETWKSRQPITTRDRLRFETDMRRVEAAVRRQKGYTLGELQRQAQASVNRVAIGKALVQSGLLEVRDDKAGTRRPAI